MNIFILKLKAIQDGVPMLIFYFVGFKIRWYFSAFFMLIRSIFFNSTIRSFLLYIK